MLPTVPGGRRAHHRPEGDAGEPIRRRSGDLGKLLRRGQFDIVHAHSFQDRNCCGVLGAGGRDSRRTWCAPSTISTTTTSAQSTRRSCRRRRAAWIEIVAISDAVADYLRTDAALPAENIVRIYYGIDPIAVLPGHAAAVAPARRRSAQAPTIGIVARLAPQKGHRVLFDALPADPGGRARGACAADRARGVEHGCRATGCCRRARSRAVGDLRGVPP